jgi:hypothetical protein
MSVDRASLIGKRLGLIMIGTDADGNEEWKDRYGTVSLESDQLVLKGDGIHLQIQPEWLDRIVPGKPGAEVKVDYLLVLTAGTLLHEQGFRQVGSTDSERNDDI